MKFTEEQFKKLVEVQEKFFIDNVLDIGVEYTHLKEAIQKSDYNLVHFIRVNYLENQAVALMNPLTREWAHEQYVEKEKRYVWTSKKRTNGGYVHRLFKSTYEGVLLATVSPEAEIVEEEYLTESEIREWGYDPERFDKEEVE